MGIKAVAVDAFHLTGAVDLRPQLFGEVGVRRHDHAAEKCVEVLVHAEAVDSGIAKGTYAPAADASEEKPKTPRKRPASKKQDEDKETD